MNGKTVVVLAGYDKEIHAMMTANPGLKSRFKQYFDFPGKSGRTDGTHTLCTGGVGHRAGVDVAEVKVGNLRSLTSNHGMISPPNTLGRLDPRGVRRLRREAVDSESRAIALRLARTRCLLGAAPQGLSRSADETWVGQRA